MKRWLPFTAEQVIRCDGGMIWSATVRLSGLPIRGFDELIAGKGAMRWKLFGIFPIMAAKGADITRSTVGRVASEFVWLPSALCADGTSWSAPNPWQAQAQFVVCDQVADLGLGIADDVRFRTMALQRWGNPESGKLHNAPFGGITSQEKTFDGYTIPSRLRIGWYIGSDRFEQDGEFFRITVDEAIFR